MQINTLKATKVNKKKKIIGRGGKRGTYSGRGIKGQKQHGSHGIRPNIRDIIKSIPKHRGYKFNSFAEKQIVVNISSLDVKFNSGEEVNPQTLFDKKLIKKSSGKLPKVKILGSGDIKKKLNISGCYISVSAKDKVEKAGGSVKEVVVKTNVSKSKKEAKKQKIDTKKTIKTTQKKKVIVKKDKK